MDQQSGKLSCYAEVTIILIEWDRFCPCFISVLYLNLVSLKLVGTSHFYERNGGTVIGEIAELKKNLVPVLVSPGDL